MSIDGFDIPGYELQRKLGSGGMATVYLGVQKSLNRKVAIKVLERKAGASADAEKRFLAESQTLAALPHRGIVGVYDVMQNDYGDFIVMPTEPCSSARSVSWRVYPSAAPKIQLSRWR